MSEIRFVTLSSDTDINKIIQEGLTQKDATTTIVLGCASEGKEAPLRLIETCFRTIPKHISIEEINEIK
ncbi:TPA: hypothetical protein ACHKBA_004613 [Escherichia coli]|jgi:hypothetical protein|uniref:Uncharacterized protein n=1 Tax=Escherichia coli TaxID=562 RepID=A0AAP6B3E3_ECOLX|nr:hypothetical protein [Escherichia coli]HBC3203122.1 hypothetical protein [Escherichia coli O146]HDQ6632010.1 hypothetical protein [Escherichia coli O22:H16]HDQ6666533.1 hypothetical protein [Escherichia coli O166:H28]HDQ6896397.1 hypothetical protein [Escherichia coli O174:H8]EEC7602110.1 hypothetical protein [Escherichia coli]